MDIGLPELLIVLVVVLILFGPGRIGKTAGELGKGIRAFKEGITGKDEENLEKIQDQVKPLTPPASAMPAAVPILNENGNISKNKE